MSRRICHGRKNKQRHKHSHGRMSKQKNKHLPRINTELHGKDRSRNTEVRPSRSISHEKNTVFRAGCVSDCLNIRFGKGPLRQAQGPGFSCGTVSELASGEPAEPVELAVEQKGSGLFFST